MLRRERGVPRLVRLERGETPPQLLPPPMAEEGEAEAVTFTPPLRRATGLLTLFLFATTGTPPPMRQESWVVIRAAILYVFFFGLFVLSALRDVHPDECACV